MHDITPDFRGIYSTNFGEGFPTGILLCLHQVKHQIL